MSGDGGNPPSLRDLLGAYEKSGLDILTLNPKQRASPLPPVEIHTKTDSTLSV